MNACRVVRHEFALVHSRINQTLIPLSILAHSLRIAHSSLPMSLRSPGVCRAAGVHPDATDAAGTASRVPPVTYRRGAV